MSDNVPFEIQIEIMKKLPVKSLIQFRSVCKSWKSLIDTSDFIANYSGHHTQPQRLLVRYEDVADFERKFVSIVDDDSFPQHKAPITMPLLVNTLKHSVIVGSSHGLLCMYGEYRRGRGGPVSGTYRAVIWNPSIRKAVDVMVPNVAIGLYGTILGFGVCGETKDPKIVKITQVNTRSDMESMTCVPRRVEVFALSTGVWRRPYRSNLPRKSVQFGYPRVVIDGFIYWLATDRVDGRVESYNMIISFDLTSEEFKQVKLPDGLVQHQSYQYLSLSKLRESLVVLERRVDANSPGFFRVWMMEDGVPDSFTKVFTVNTPHPTIGGFRNTGEPIIEIVKDLGIFNGVDFSFSVHPYMESLLLLDQPDLIVYEKGKHYVAKWRAKSRRLSKRKQSIDQ